MPFSSLRRARVRVRTLVVALALLAPWVPGTPPVAARDSGSSSTDGCGDDWSSAHLIDTLGGPLLEVSGFVSSARYPGVAWMIRDSQNPDSLYSFQLDGDHASWKEFPISGTSNHDWEDVTYTVGPDGRGRLWILENDFAGGDSGNSSMKIYEILEPDPYGDGSARLAGTYRFAYPDGNVDTEAIFAIGGRLLVVTKTTPDRVFRLPWPMSRSGTNRLIPAGSLDDAGSLLTTTAISGDERLLATVSTSDSVSVFANGSGSGEFSAFTDHGPVFRRSMPETQREAIDFFPYEGCDLVSVSEDGTVWRLSNPRSIHPLGPPPAPTDPVTPGPAANPDPAVPAPAVHEPEPAAAPGTGRGYWMLGFRGTVYAFGEARHLGEPAAGLGGATAVDLEPTPSGAGYWVVDDWGGVFVYGDARHYGDVDPEAMARGEVVTSLSGVPTGDGYWIFTSRGRALPFGSARHLGDVAKLKLNGPVLDSVSTPSGLGYYMVASDGGIFTFGDAVFFGSMGGTRLNAPVQSLVPDADGVGYWLVASDGGIFAFDAPFRGSLGAIRLNKPVTGMDRFGNGYLMVGEDGGIFNFSDRPFSGSLGDRPPARPIVSVAALD